MSLLLLAGGVACDDGPTSPGVYTHAAEGSVWAAVVVPQSIPELRTWLPYIRPQPGEVEPALDRLRELRREAEYLRRAGEVEKAWAVEEAATRHAAESLTEMPPVSVLIAALGALDVWAERAGGALVQGEFAGLAADLEAVREYRRNAYGALQAGDTAVAVRDLAAAAALVRGQAPQAVAARALARAEVRLSEAPVEDGDATRALRLLRHAREALAAGDGARALQRALYALQLAERIGERAGTADPAPRPAGVD